MNTEPTMRGEIQGLRAIAVVLVLLFHVWPDTVPGGYVGVDVFFVISGYLIVGSLAREAERNGRVSLLDFYSRRVRRLLPAASIVLAAVFVAMFFFLPAARWEETAIQVAASALYAENWYLAWAAVDYLASENAASPVQHYWSLSIEEQFYIVWPLIVLGVAWLCRRTGMAFRPLMGVALGLIFVSSLAASLLLTASDPGSAYFVTHTRAWELALGGLVAIWLPRIEAGGSLRAALCLAGLAAILTSGLAYSAGTPFPGHAALVPTLGAALVILAGDVRAGFFRGLNLAPLRYLGDISYSLYLWHWPLIVFYTVGRGQIGPRSGIALIVVTIVVSHLSYRHIEQRFRRPGEHDGWRPLVLGAASISACLLAVATFSQTLALQATAEAKVRKEMHPGGLVMFSDIRPPVVDAPVPSLALLKHDMPSAYDEKCHVAIRGAALKPCERGNRDGDFHVVIVGDSHAANWLPALEEASLARGWKLDSHTKSGCPLLKKDVPLRDQPYRACTLWGERLLAQILDERPDVVIFAQSSGQRLFPRDRNEAVDEMADAITEVWSDLVAVGIKVIAMRDTPRLPIKPDECLMQNAACSVSAGEVFPHEDPIPIAASQAGVPLIDMTDAFCTEHECPIVIGNVIVWRDFHHMTATYSASLSNVLAERIIGAIERHDKATRPPR